MIKKNGHTYYKRGKYWTRRKKNTITIDDNTKMENIS